MDFVFIIYDSSNTSIRGVFRERSRAQKELVKIYDNEGSVGVVMKVPLDKTFEEIDEMMLSKDPDYLSK